MTDTNRQTIAKLLRAIAKGTDAQKLKHDVIFNTAADMIDRPEYIIEQLIEDLHKAGRSIQELTAVHRELYEAIQNPISHEFNPNDDEQFQVINIDKREYERWKRAESIIRARCNIS